MDNKYVANKIKRKRDKKKKKKKKKFDIFFYSLLGMVGNEGSSESVL